MLSQVFISYKREEVEFANLVESKLKEANFKVFIDYQMPGGVEWQNHIDENIKKSFALIVIMTPKAKESEYVTYEWIFALGAGLTVIPLLVDIERDVCHPRLKSFQCIENRDPQCWNKLIDSVRKAQSKQLTIHHAIWGADMMNNVTDKVRAKVSPEGKLDMLADIEYLCDPAEDHRKKLVVVYSYEGKIDFEEVEEVRKEEERETGRLILPK